MGDLSFGAYRLGTVNNVVVATTSTSVASAAFGSETWRIRVSASAACFLKIDNGAVTAANTDALLNSTWIEVIKVSPGQKIAIFSPTIQTISVVELTN